MEKKEINSLINLLSQNKLQIILFRHHITTLILYKTTDLNHKTKCFLIKKKSSKESLKKENINHFLLKKKYNSRATQLHKLHSFKKVIYKRINKGIRRTFMILKVKIKIQKAVIKSKSQNLNKTAITIDKSIGIATGIRMRNIKLTNLALH